MVPKRNIINVLNNKNHLLIENGRRKFDVFLFTFLLIQNTKKSHSSCPKLGISDMVYWRGRAAYSNQSLSALQPFLYCSCSLRKGCECGKDLYQSQSLGECKFGNYCQAMHLTSEATLKKLPTLLYLLTCIQSCSFN